MAELAAGEVDARQGNGSNCIHCSRARFDAGDRLTTIWLRNNSARGEREQGIRDFTGTANPALARLIASKVGGQVGACVVDRYPDSNVVVQFLETVRRKEVFLMQSTSPPVGDQFGRTSGWQSPVAALGARVTSVLPYFVTGERISGWPAEQIMARVVADLMEVVRIRHLIARAKYAWGPKGHAREMLPFIIGEVTR